MTRPRKIEAFAMVDTGDPDEYASHPGRRARSRGCFAGGGGGGSRHTAHTAHAQASAHRTACGARHCQHTRGERGEGEANEQDEAALVIWPLLGERGWKGVNPKPLYAACGGAHTLWRLCPAHTPARQSARSNTHSLAGHLASWPGRAHSPHVQCEGLGPASAPAPAPRNESMCVHGPGEPPARRTSRRRRERKGRAAPFASCYRTCVPLRGSCA